METESIGATPVSSEIAASAGASSEVSASESPEAPIQPAGAKDEFEPPEITARREQIKQQMSMLKAQQEFAREESQIRRLQEELHRQKEYQEMQAALEKERHASLMGILRNF